MNHPSLLCALLLALIPPAGALAQENPGNDAVPTELGTTESVLMLTVGPRLQQSVEQLLFGRRDAGVLGQGALTWMLIGAESETLLEGRLEAGAGGMTNSWEMPTESYELALMARGLFVQPGDLPIVLGGYVRGSWSLQFRERLDQSHFYWLTAYELGPSLASGIPLSESVIALFRVSAPIAALVSRPEEHRLYNDDFPSFGDRMSTIHRGLGFASVTSYRGVDIEIDVPVVLADDWLAQTFGYRFIYRTSTDPRPVSYLAHLFTLSLLVRL